MGRWACGGGDRGEGEMSKSSEQLYRHAVYVAWAYWEEVYPEAQFVFADEEERTYGQERILAVRNVLKDALTAPKETDLERLREWLEICLSECLLAERSVLDPAIGIKEILRYVRDEFGVTGGEDAE